MEYDHENWRDDVKALPGNSSSQVQDSGPSPHDKQNQNWLHNLQVNFLQVVVENCSSRCRQAVQTDEVIQVNCS